MRIKKNTCPATLFLIILLLLNIKQTVSAQTAETSYRSLQKGLSSGWNTWNTKSLLSFVKLPEGFTINIGMANTAISPNSYLQECYLSNRTPRPEHVKPGYHTYDGSYTDCTITWEGLVFRVESAHDGPDLVILVTPLTKPIVNKHLIVEVGMLWNKKGNIRANRADIKARVNQKNWTINSTSSQIADPLPLTTPYLAYNFNKPTGISTGRRKNLKQIQAIINGRRLEFEAKIKGFGALKDTYLAQQSALAWNMIYDPQRAAVIAPVSRSWNTFFGGHYVLFDWDTYLSGLMASFDNKALAYANVVEVTKTVDDWGMVPNYKAGMLGSPDRSQPPVGSLVVHELYKKYKDKWLLDLTYKRLLKWNRWWPSHRDTDGYLCWGSDDIPPDDAANTAKGAGYESGLDNSPMYDGVPFNNVTHQMALADVGLMSLYIADCLHLADIADIINKPHDAIELRQRASKYRLSLQTLWNNDFGMFLNKRTDNGEWSYRLSPTLFYPLIAKAATPVQASRMVNDHLLNTKEFWGDWVIPSAAKNDTAFYSQDYWRGRIWAPLNFLVYKGLNEYDFPSVKKELAEKSNKLLLNNWQATKGIYENYHITGIGRLPEETFDKSDNFYHWGALLGYIYLLEQQKSDQNNSPVSNR